MERPLWEGIALTTTLEKLIGLLNQRLARWADLIAREQRWNVRSVTADTTLTEADDVVLVDTTSSAVNVFLPPVSGTRGKTYCIKKTNAGANNVVIDGSGSETIDGAATVTFNTQWLVKQLVSTGSAWMIVSTS